MVKLILARWNFDRLLLAMYSIALMALLTLPISEPEFRLFGIESDKWTHVALFGGLAALLRWNFSEKIRALLVSIAAAFVVAAAIEMTQALVAYRSAEMWDLVAGLLGAILGAISVDRILSSVVLQKFLGPLVVILGVMIAAFFLLADVIGVGSDDQIGLRQMAGITLGALIAVGGGLVQLIGLPSSARIS